jgi:predicted metal-dependent hydrolase
MVGKRHAACTVGASRGPVAAPAGRTGIIRRVNLFRLPLDPGEGDDVVIRESVRSRRLLVRVHESAQVEVVVPRGTPPPLVEQFVSRHLDWISTRVARARARARPPEPFPPAQIHLVALGEHWTLHVAGGRGPVRVRPLGEDLLQLTGDGAAPAQHAALRRWLIGRAREVLPDWLGEIATLHGFRYGDAQVRLQRTRWGSCSTRGRVSLNAALLFQPPDVLRYLLVHELAHTRHMNHSSRFWALVAGCEPDYRRLDAQLRRGWRNVPDWLRPQRRVVP